MGASVSSSPPTHPQPPSSHHIAIIGAGLSGATAAHHLSSLANTTGTPIHITIFESTNRVGGRVHTVFAPEDRNARVPLEAGAPAFFADDWCLAGAAAAAQLELVRGGGYAESVWDGRAFRADPMCAGWGAVAAGGGWWERVVGRARRWGFDGGMWLRYGSALKLFERLSGTSLGKWMSVGRGEAPFTSVRDEMERVGLDNEVAFSGKKFLAGNGIGDFAGDFVQPCARGLGGQNLSHMSGLASLTPGYWESRTPVSIKGGNSLLIQRLIEQSGADLRLNTKVDRINLGDQRRYELLFEGWWKEEASREAPQFDAVFFAAPLTNQEFIISFPLAHHPGHVQYSPAHVTHFSTALDIPHHVSRRLDRLVDLPSDVTSGSALEEISTFSDMSAFRDNGPAVPVLGDRGYLSLAQATQPVRYTRDCLPDDECDQFEMVTRVVSQQELSDDDILSLVGQTPESGLKRGDKMIDISWIDRQAWPKGYPKFTNKGDGKGQVEIAEGFSYLAAGEMTLGSMEMACRMGRNGGSLLASRWLEAKVEGKKVGSKEDKKVDKKEEL